MTIALTTGFLSGCGHTDYVVVSDCSWTEAIEVTEEDIMCMSRGTKEQILNHNESWEEQIEKRPGK